MPLNTFPTLRSFWLSKRPWDRWLTILFLIVILITIGAIVYVLTSPGAAEKYTEFYILGREGKAENYPGELQLGREASIIVGIVNGEYKPTSYNLEMVIDNRTELELGPIVLNHREKWEKPVVFKPAQVGIRQRVEFRLYRDGDAVIYRSVYLFINVIPSNLGP